MTMTADQRLIAYLDNELSAEERARFEADMAKDEWLAAEVAKHRGLAARIASAHAPAPEAAAPGRLKAMASAAKDRSPRGRAASRWIAMAACLVLGASIGAAYWPLQSLVETPAAPVDGPLMVAKGGVLTVQGDLEKALNTQLGAQAGPITVSLTFKGRNGRYCRTFESIPDHLAGVACREADDHWVAQTTTRFMPTAPTADYKTVGSDLPDIILAAVEALKAEDPLDGAAERAARDKGWKPDPAPAPALKAEAAVEAEPAPKTVAAN